MTFQLKNVPATVKVGTHTYTIETTAKSSMDDIGIYGDCNADRRRIRLADEQPEASHAVDVMLHELIHACYRAYNIEAERGEEYTVTAIATALTGVLIDNPEMRKWIDRTSR